MFFHLSHDLPGRLREHTHDRRLASKADQKLSQSTTFFRGRF
jgi:hypothetical protein